MFCIGGSNDAIEYAGYIEEPNWNRLFQRDPETRETYSDFRTELYLKDRCPLTDLECWRHESLDTPEKFLAAARITNEKRETAAQDWQTRHHFR